MPWGKSLSSGQEWGSGPNTLVHPPFLSGREERVGGGGDMEVGGTEGRRKEESWKEVKGVGTNQTQEAWLY